MAKLVKFGIKWQKVAKVAENDKIWKKLQEMAKSGKKGQKVAKSGKQGAISGKNFQRVVNVANGVNVKKVAKSVQHN